MKNLTLLMLSADESNYMKIAMIIEYMHINKRIIIIPTFPHSLPTSLSYQHNRVNMKSRTKNV